MLDFKEPFDIIDHKILVQKMQLIVIKEPALELSKITRPIHDNM